MNQVKEKKEIAFRLSGKGREFTPLSESPVRSPRWSSGEAGRRGDERSGILQGIPESHGHKPAVTGFTLVELALVVAILSISATIALPAWQSFSDSVALSNTAKMVETKIKIAKSFSLGARGDTNYGIHFDASSITLFTGSTYSAGDPGNMVYALPSGVELYDIFFTGGSGYDVVFNRLIGTTDNPGSVKARITARPARSKQIFINAQGQTSTESFGASAGAPVVEDAVNGINARHIHFTLAAWSIQSKPPTTDLIFRKGDNTLIEDIDTASYFNAGIFNWEGTVTVDGAAQKLRIHTLNAGGTTLCIMRDRTENNKTLSVSFKDNGIEKKIVTYTENADGTVTVAPNTPLYVSSMSAQ